MKTIAMIVTLAAGLASFGLSASAENSNKQAAAPAAQAVPATMPASNASAFLPGSAMKQPAWVTYGSMRQ